MIMIRRSGMNASIRGVCNHDGGEQEAALSARLRRARSCRLADSHDGAHNRDDFFLVLFLGPSGPSAQCLRPYLYLGYPPRNTLLLTMRLKTVPMVPTIRMASGTTMQTKTRI